jgi:hypothetical protein
MIKDASAIVPLLALLAWATIGRATASEPSERRLAAPTAREASWPRTIFVSTSKGSALLAPLACVLKPKGKIRLGNACPAGASPPTALRLSDLRVLKTRGWKSVRLSPWGEDDAKDLVLALQKGFAEEKGPLFGFGKNARPRSVEAFDPASPPPGDAAVALATLRAHGTLATETLRVMARMDLNEDGQPEWLLYRRCVNEFRFELYDATFSLVAQYGHCGI